MTQCHVKRGKDQLLPLFHSVSNDGQVLVSDVSGDIRG